MFCPSWPLHALTCHRLSKVEGWKACHVLIR